MSKHTPEPWPTFINCCEPSTPVPDSEPIVRLGFDDYNMARACVNACAGMDDPAAEIEKLRRQRDELLNLVKQARLEWLDQNQTSDDTDVVTPYDHVLYWGDC